MTQTVAQELLLILIVTGLGAGNGILFDCYRLIRRQTRQGYLSTQFTDLLFWVICAGLDFYVFFQITGGVMRFLAILFLPVGMVLYLRFISPYVREPLYFCFLQIGRFLRLLLKLMIICGQTLLFPFRLTVWTLNFLLQCLLGLFRLLILPFRCCWRFVWRWIREWRRKKD
jgi:spore cortex biosynthesis protein YabQ